MFDQATSEAPQDAAGDGFPVTLGELRRLVVGYAAGFDVALIDPTCLKRALKDASAAENSLSHIKSLLAARLADTDTWRTEGFNDPAEQLARMTGSSVSKSREAIKTGRRVDELEATAEAARNGELSPDQTAAIADAATAAADPAVEKKLLEKAKSSSLRDLNEDCARAKAAADPDLEARERRIHRARSLREWTDRDGTWHCRINNTTTAGAIVMAAVKQARDDAFTAARSEGRRENMDAYMADGVTAICAGYTASRSTGALSSASSTSSPAALPYRPTPGPFDSDPPDEGGDAPATLFDQGADNGSSDPTTRSGPLGDNDGSGPSTQHGPAGDNEGSDPTTSFGPSGDERVSDRATHGATAPVTVPSPPGEAARAAQPSGANRAAPSMPAATSSTAADRPATRKQPAPNRGPWRDAKIIFLVSLDAYRRGHPVDGEMCEIAGVGVVPVSVVEEALSSGDPFVAAVLFDGVDVASVAHLGRKPTAYQLTALQAMGVKCTRDICGTSHGLEIDHREDWAKTKITSLKGLDWVCRREHDLKTHKGWAFVEGVGPRPFVPPDDPRHPRHANAPPDTS